MPETAYATRAKLTMPTPPDHDKWIAVNDRIRTMPDRKHLLVSNTGPKQEGYNYCTLCGRIEAYAEATAALGGPHAKPNPDEKEPNCPGGKPAKHMMLGTDFVTDIRSEAHTSELQSLIRISYAVFRFKTKNTNIY